MVSAIGSHHHVQVIYNESNDGPASIVAKKVAENLERMKNEGHTYGALKPAPLTMIIMDRTVDPVTPLLHDLYYHPLVFDLLEIKDNMYEFETVNEKGFKNMKIVKFNETNSLWCKFRNTAFVTALQTIVSEFNHFINNNSAAKVQKGELDNLDCEKMAEIVKGMPHYQDMMNEYSFHIQLLEKTAAFFKSRNLVQACELEQSVVTGSDAKGKPYKFSAFGELNNFKTSEDRIRFILILVLSHSLDDSSFAKLKKSLTPEEKLYLESLSVLGLRPGRYKLNLQNVNKVEGNPHADYDRTTPKVREVVEQIRVGNMPTGFTSIVVPKDEPFPNLKVSKGDMLKQKFNKPGADDTVKPIFCVFMIGGIGTSEVRELRDIQTDKELGGVVMIVGGTNYFTPLDYLHELKIINQEDDEPEETKVNVGHKTQFDKDEEALLLA